MTFSRETVLFRALSWVGAGEYKLGSGGRLPSFKTPFSDGKCDCSGFVCWALGLDRRQVLDNGAEVWLSTDGMIEDALGPKRFFKPTVGLWKAGDLVVYGGSWLAGVRTRVGHVGILYRDGVALTHQVPVVHCSAGAYKNYGAAVAMTGAAPWMKYVGAKNGTVILTRV